MAKGRIRLGSHDELKVDRGNLVDTRLKHVALDQRQRLVHRYSVDGNAKDGMASGGAWEQKGKGQESRGKTLSSFLLPYCLTHHSEIPSAAEDAEDDVEEDRAQDADQDHRRQRK